MRPSSPQQDAESSESCSVFDDDPNCCDGKILTENFLCNPRNFRVRKRHPSHDKVCGDLTFNSGNEVCFKLNKIDVRLSKVNGSLKF